MNERAKLNEKLREYIRQLPGVVERPKAGMHEDAFFVGKTMFMHIHGQVHCDIRLSHEAQQAALAAGNAQPHRWAPQQGYITAIVDNDEMLANTLELIQQSHAHFASQLNPNETV